MQPFKSCLIVFFFFLPYIVFPQHPEVRVSWDRNSYLEQTSVKVVNKGYVETECFYPRIKKLSDGSLLMTFMNNVVGFDIFTRKSYDNGKTWTDAVMVRQRYVTTSTAAANDKMVFATPDFIPLQDGHILLAYQWRLMKGYNDLEHTNRNCGIEIMVSDDQGETFSDPRIIYYGRCWEPALLQLPSGEIQLYITDSNEVMNKLSQPCVALLRSFDNGETWQNKKITTFEDGEVLSRTFDERGSYDGMPCARYLTGNNGIAMSLEVWSSKFLVDETPVIVYTSNADNWRYGNNTIREKGGPGPDRKKQLHKDFRGFGPYMEILPAGEILVQSNGVYKGEQGMWVFLGDKKANCFSHVSSPYVGYWGAIAYIGNDEVMSSGTYTYETDGKRHDGIRLMKGKLNYAKKVQRGKLQLQPLSSFDHTIGNDWFIGEATPSSAYLNFGNTGNNFEFTAYLFDKNLISFTAENSDAVDFLLNRRDTITNEQETYRFVINAKGVFSLKKLHFNSWVAQDVSRVKEIGFNCRGTVNDETDEDTGFSALVSVPWSLIGGVPGRNEEFRVHLRHGYKDAAKEAPFARIEGVAGEDEDDPDTWLGVSFVD